LTYLPILWCQHLKTSWHSKRLVNVCLYRSRFNNYVCACWTKSAFTLILYWITTVYVFIKWIQTEVYQNVTQELYLVNNIFSKVVRQYEIQRVWLNNGVYILVSCWQSVRDETWSCHWEICCKLPLINLAARVVNMYLYIIILKLY